MLLYSGGWWESSGYAIGYGTCDSPLGPCTKATIDGPLVASVGEEAGPGGACVVTGPAETNGSRTTRGPKVQSVTKTAAYEACALHRSRCATASRSSHADSGGELNSRCNLRGR